MIRIVNKIINRLRKLRYNKLRQQITNTKFSLISNNCVGAILLHDLHLPFLSPTVNAGMTPSDFNKFLSNLDYYLSLEMQMAPDEAGDNYQYGYLGDLHVCFMHYKYLDEPRVKWNERRLRVNKDNLFIIMTERDDCTYDDLLTFDNLPYKNKVVFTCREYPEIKSSCYVPNCVDAETGQLDYVYEYPHFWSLKRKMEIFDFVGWFNGQL